MTRRMFVILYHNSIRSILMKNLILKIDRPAFGGQFIARHEGKVVMIKGAVLPGETVEAAVENERKDYITASAGKILEPSPLRITPQCDYFGICGGCSFQHIPYELQVRLKEEILGDCLKRISHMEIDLDASIISSNQWAYRQRGQLKVSSKGFGLHKKGSNDVINIDECIIMDNAINKYIKQANDLVKETRIKEFHITSGDSPVAQIITRKNALSPPDTGKLASRLIDSGLSGLMALIGENPPLCFGNTFVSTSLLNYKYTLSPPSFIQANWKLNLSVVEIILNTFHPLKGKKLLDLYAGAGNFSIPLAGEAEVTAVEGNPYAVEDGRRNLAINNITSCGFVHSSAEDFHTKEHFDIAILDPPRPGLTKAAMRNILSIMPGKIIYLSCNPATFARDLKTLQAKYEIGSIRMIDFFPQTFHIEALALLSLR